MTKKTKPISRLTLVFILAVVVSGSILTWFSINNISNLKELTEKRIIEEQRELADRISSELQDNLEKATSAFKNEFAPVEQLRDELIKTASRYEYFSMSFILDTKGQFLFPNFTQAGEGSVKKKSSSRYNSKFQDGEKAEFTKQSLSQARASYALCLKYSKTTADSVKALNAQARVLVKLKRFKAAVQNYETIINKHYTATGSDGFPYAYYAMSQILKSYTKENSSNIKLMIHDFMGKMVAGLVQLNFYTSELMDEVRKWANENVSNDEEYHQNIIKLTKEIDEQLQFVERYKNEVLHALNGNESATRINAGNGFVTLSSFSANGRELLITKKEGENHFGFLVDGARLFTIVLQANLQNNFEFAYVIEPADSYSNGTNNKQLAYTVQPSPIFRNRYMKIGLQNENVINELVKRRSWIYGIASVLLIVAMFLGVFLILRDISREKHLARLRADFISNVTHELKTPLTSIYMFAESLLLRRVKSTMEKQEYLSIIIKESDRLKRMINNILEFSKMEKGKSDYHFIYTNLAQTVKDALLDLDYWLEKEDFNLITNLDENINAKFDPDKMKQALSNLISNAIKYSGDSKEIFIGLHKNSNGIVIEIKDKGIGIPEGKIQRIFEKFYRIDQKENISGTGLGLTVVKEIVEAHNGNISVSSKMGEGSKFSIILKQ